MILEQCKGVHRVDLDEELSNAYLLAKFRFDTAENEPCKVCPGAEDAPGVLLHALVTDREPGSAVRDLQAADSSGCRTSWTASDPEN